MSVYGLSLTGLVLHKQQDAERRDMVIKNIEQFLRAGRRKPDRMAATAGIELVVLVRKRQRGDGRVSEAARRRSSQ